MDFYSNFFKLTIHSFGLGLFSPILWAIIFLIYSMYKRIQYDENMLNENKSISLILIDSVVYGILGGIIASLITSFLGIYISINIQTVVIFTIIITVLSVLNLIYFNYCYSLAAITLIKIVFKDLDIDIVGLLSLVSIIYIIKSFLIITNGRNNLVPTYLKIKERIVGGFYTVNYWPVPIVFLTMSIMLNSNIPYGSFNINEPMWWPLIQPPQINDNQTFFYTMIALPIAVSYKDIYTYEKPEKIIKLNSLFYFLLGSILIIVTIVFCTNIVAIYIILLILPIIYEAYILYKKNVYYKKGSIYDPAESGVRILYPKKDGPGHRTGVKSGDILLSINNIEVNNSLEITNALKSYPKFIWIKIYRNNDIIELQNSFYPNGINDLELFYVEGHMEKSGNVDINQFYKNIILRLNKK